MTHLYGRVKLVGDVNINNYPEVSLLFILKNLIPTDPCSTVEILETEANSKHQVPKLIVSTTVEVYSLSITHTLPGPSSRFLVPTSRIEHVASYYAINCSDISANRKIKVSTMTAGLPA